MRIILAILFATLSTATMPVLAGDTALKVEAIELTAAELPRVLQLNGTLEPLRRTALAAEVGAVVIARPAKLGQRAKAGQILVQLDTSSYALQVRWQNAQVDLARSQFDLAERNFERARSLLQDHSLAQESYDQAQADYVRGRSLMRQAQVALDQAQLDLDRTSIRAPFAGAIIALEVEIGELVSPGQPTVHLAATDTLKISAEVSADELAWLTAGLPVQIRPAAAVDFLNGTLAHISRVTDARSRRYPIEAYATAVPPNLALGSVAALTITTAASQTGVLLPAMALRRFSGATYAYVLVAKNDTVHVEQRQVQVSRELPGGLFFIIAGLAPGERVAASATAVLTAGDGVQLSSVRRLDLPLPTQP